MIHAADIREWRTHDVVDPKGPRIGVLEAVYTDDVLPAEARSTASCALTATGGTCASRPSSDSRSDSLPLAGAPDRNACAGCERSGRPKKAPSRSGARYLT